MTVNVCAFISRVFGTDMNNNSGDLFNNGKYICEFEHIGRCQPSSYTVVEVH